MTDDSARWQKRLEREKVARQQAERLLEQKSRELYETNQKLTELANDLEQQVIQRTEALKQLLHKAEAGTRAKSEFLAIMSHEIRTPLNGISGMVQLLQMSPLTEEQEIHLNTIRASSDALLLLINDILDFSKIDAGKLELDLHSFDLKFLIRSIIDLYLPITSQKELWLNVQFVGDFPPTVRGDSTRIRQVLSNLLSNALKFTHQGGISVLATLDNTSDGHRLHVAVTDTGIGIPADRLQKLFQEFTQADSSTTREYGGTGLGLAICKRLVEAMGGAISAESEPGLKTTFVFDVRLGACSGQKDNSAPPIHELPSRAFKALKTLVVDDNAVNRQLAISFLKKLGVEPDMAHHGLEAIDKLKAVNYDLILMDLQMPEMDGFEATQVIRADTSLKQPFILALTANAFNEDRDVCLANGFDDFLSKPFRFDDLKDKVSKAILQKTG